jgi:hypothetical protein
MKSDLDTLRNNTNSTAYPSVQMDSTQAINAITKQKVQELLDLSLIYANGNKNTSIDTVIFNQMKSYFYQPDSTTFKALFKDLDSNQVKSARVNKLEVFKKITKKDTLDFAKFNVEYINKNNKSVGHTDKIAQYILVYLKRKTTSLNSILKAFMVKHRKTALLLATPNNPA